MDHRILAPAGPLVDESTPARLSAQRLRNTLRINTVTSTIGGLLAATLAGPMSDAFGTGHAGWYRVIGLGLVAFAVGVAVTAGARTSRLLRWTPAITAADLIWTVASITTVLLGWYSTVGAATITAVAGVVGALGLNQAVGLRRTRSLVGGRLSALDETPPVEVVHVERLVQGDVATAWQVVTDHELYRRLALNLSRVEAGTGNGPELTRTCVNRNGEEWHETCTLWDDQHRYEVAVDTANYPYPLAVMRGAWYVEEAGTERVRIGMDFRFQPRSGLWGRVFVAAMHSAFPPTLGRILRGWRREIATRMSASRR